MHDTGRFPFETIHGCHATMKLRDVSYRPPLRTTYEMPGGDYCSVAWGKEYWVFPFRVSYSKIIELIEWLDEYAGLDWDFYDMFVGKIADGGSWTAAHNNRRIQLENVCNTHYNIAATALVSVEIANPRVAVLAKLKFDVE